MKNSIAAKIKISIFVFIISLIYFSCFDFLGGRLGRLGFSLLSFWPIVFYSFISVFIYPYIKIASQNILKRGLFFGIIVWIIDFPQILMNLRQTLMMFDIPRAFALIKAPLYFIILGLIIGFCYKKFLPIEFNLSFKKLKTSFVKIIPAIIFVTLIYLLFMYFSGLLIFYKMAYQSISGYISSLLNPWLYINPLIYGLIFTLLYTKTIRKVDISGTKKWVLFSLFISFFTTPLILPMGNLIQSFFRQSVLAYNLLLIPHLLSIFIIGYLLIKFFNKQT